jgi:hypothetical protein
LERERESLCEANISLKRSKRQLKNLAKKKAKTKSPSLFIESFKYNLTRKSQALVTIAVQAKQKRLLSFAGLTSESASLREASFSRLSGASEIKERVPLSDY